MRPLPARSRLPGNRSLVLISVAVLALLGVSTPAVAHEAAAEDYVALGDSYSSGTGAGDYGDSGSCKRSANAYPRLWADAHGADITFAACSGARTPDVLNNQLGGLDAGTTLVTISVGGNDAGFTDVITTCTLGSDQTCLDRIDEAKDYVHGTLPGLLDNVYDTIQDRAPNAEIIVLGYPRLYQLDGSCNVGLSETKRAAINSAADTLAEVTSQRVAAAGLTFVDLRGPFAGHGICSADWWLHSLTWPIDHSYHPNQEGQALGYLPALNGVTG
ncbi:SGNH/GDSL hydrolase family protein [Amycolatopsis cihanbeyliensis]|uniref:GDSL-like lipase/acylhydrolase family protein n=1 Tax=Amycolatopsis cihanbeyliensis TaxID=1128664 RepID=A0A542DHI4_AMYCI|nr:SGNH/GDSL hydrolase family protein [Amycolatopsis cihanbeyliensis]TQJ02496.1 GDSL-like lipase/acylhydrolase family protein [Amycolatopsis cihanbeyliensis]